MYTKCARFGEVDLVDSCTTLKKRKKKKITGKML